MSFRRLPSFIALVCAALLTASPAEAHTGHSVTVVRAGSRTTVTVVFGPYEMDTVVFDFAAGWKFAHDDSYGNELSSNPNDGEEIGTGSMKAAWTSLFCLTSTQSMSLFWEEDMTGAPAGAVAHYRMTTALATTDGWVIEENDSTDDYKLVFDLDQSTTCSTQPSDANMTITLYETTAGGRAVHQPPTSGCSVTVSSVDVFGASHSGTGSC